MITGFIPYLLDKILGLGLSYQAKGFIVFSCSVAAFLVSMLFYKSSPEDYKERCAEFYRKMHTPVDFEKEVGESNDGYQLKVIGLLGIITAGLIFLLLLVPNALSGRLCILSVGLFVLVIGGLMFGAGIKKIREGK